MANRFHLGGVVTVKEPQPALDSGKSACLFTPGMVGVVRIIDTYQGLTTIYVGFRKDWRSWHILARPSDLVSVRITRPEIFSWIVQNYQAEADQGVTPPYLTEYFSLFPEFVVDLMDFGFSLVAAGQPINVPSPDQSMQTVASLALQSGVSAFSEPESKRKLGFAGLVGKFFYTSQEWQQLLMPVNLSEDLLVRLEANGIQMGSIPALLYEQLARALRVTPSEVATCVAGSTLTPPLGGLWPAKSDQATPTFLEAVEQSPLLSGEQKRYWAAETAG